MTARKAALLFALLFAFPAAFAPARAFADPLLHFPLNCTIGSTCWIVNYVDTDAGPGVQDYTCGQRSYDGHDGVDIGLPDKVAMETGVTVTAAAPGTVLNIRDGVEDKEPTDKEMAELLAGGHGCGNGVMVDLGQGWKTLYCHMQKGSIAVKTGQQVRTGDILGRVGQSGAAEFPHLHVSVLHDGAIVDPFTGAEQSGAQSAGCGGDTHKGLWDPAVNLAYEPVILYAAGFHGGVPDFDAIKIDSQAPRTVDAHAVALTYWTAFYGVRAGDRIRMSITGPDGRVFAARDMVQEKNKARQFYYIGRQAGSGIAPGAYKASTVLTRPGGAGLTRSIERAVLVR